MSREIRSVAPEIASATSKNDFKDRLVKLIPSEIVTAYITILGLIKAAAIKPEAAVWIGWVVFGILLILTPFYLTKVALVQKKGQILFTTIAFVIWAFAVGGPFVSLINDEQLTSLIGSILLILYTMLIPIVYKG
jgi:hypothetical protein